MKTAIRNLCHLSALIAGLGLIPAGRVTAQTFTTLHSFDLSDGAAPSAVILSDNTLYGTTHYGGGSGNGTVFAVNSDGTGFTTLHSFTATTDYRSPNSDGAGPLAELILSGKTLYGTAERGGSSGNGTVFALNTDGTGFTTLYGFTATTDFRSPNSDGAGPWAELILSGKTLYGTAERGGSSGNGTVFAVNTDGTGFTTLYHFTATLKYPSPPINSDGAVPRAGLISSGTTLYGTALVGGSSGRGTVFKVNTDGTGFTNLHSFTALSNAQPWTNSDGANPRAGLILSGNTLYGTTTQGGDSGKGTVFAVNTDGTGFTILQSFPHGTDGATPYAALSLSGNTLYGTAYSGGSSGSGTIFAVNTTGTGYTNLHSFPALISSTNSDGAFPAAGLLLSGNTLYGAAANGGSSGNGTVFSLSLPPPPLKIVRSGADVTLTWPADSGFTLQSTTDLESPAAWSPVLPEPSVVDGMNAVSHPIFGIRKFFRLSQ